MNRDANLERKKRAGWKKNEREGEVWLLKYSQTQSIFIFIHKGKSSLQCIARSSAEYGKGVIDILLVVNGNSQHKGADRAKRLTT